MYSSIEKNIRTTEMYSIQISTEAFSEVRTIPLWNGNAFTR